MPASSKVVTIIEWHWDKGQYGRLPLLARELLSRNVDAQSQMAKDVGSKFLVLRLTQFGCNLRAIS